MKVVIFDIEASCEDKNINKNYNMETIEIGAVKVENGKIVDTFQTFIKPEYVQSLTPFCTELTGIIYEDLKDAPTFNEAIVNFYEFIYGLPIYSCGEFDRKFLLRELSDKGEDYAHTLTANAIKANHRNLKVLFNKVTGEKMAGMTKMAEILSVELTGIHHRALDDTLNLAKIYIKLDETRKNQLELTFKDKINKIVERINISNSRNFKVQGEEIFEGQSVMDIPDFMDHWAYVILADHADTKSNYLSNSELNKLYAFKSMDALEGKLKF